RQLPHLFPSPRGAVSLNEPRVKVKSPESAVKTGLNLVKLAAGSPIAFEIARAYCSGVEDAAGTLGAMETTSGKAVYRFEGFIVDCARGLLLYDSGEEVQ